MELDLGELIVEDEFDFGEFQLDVIQDTPPLIDLEITPSIEEQIFTHEGAYGYDKVKVKRIEREKYKPRATTMNFRNYEGTELDYETQNLDTSNFTDMSNMFYYCTGLLSLDVSGFNTSNVTTMNSMFYQCQNLTTLDLRNFDFSKVTNIQNMFRYCRYLKHLDIRTLTFDNITSFSGAFQFYSTNNDIEIIVKSEVEKEWFATNYSGYSNVKTLDEYISEGGE